MGTAARSASAWIDDLDIIAARSWDYTAVIEDVLASPAGWNWPWLIVLWVILALSVAWHTRLLK